MRSFRIKSYAIIFLLEVAVFVIIGCCVDTPKTGGTTSKQSGQHRLEGSKCCQRQNI